MSILVREWDPESFRRLLLRSLIALVLCAILVAICYFFVDRPVAFFVHAHPLSGYPSSEYPVFKWLTYPPPIVESWTPVVLVALAVRRAWGPFHRWERVLFAACVALIVAEQFRETVSFAFGRYWPSTWTHDNPSLIKDGAYGFHPFVLAPPDERGWYGSFPSGHTARTVSVAAVIWVGFPWWRWAAVVMSVAVVTGLLAMNYHFVGDVVGGAFVGGLVGLWTAHFCGATASAPGAPPQPAHAERQEQ